MRFEEFAESHGLHVRLLIPGRWVAVPTVDHPKKKNGRYKYLGDIGWVQNWATMSSPAVWKGEKSMVSPHLRQMLKDAEQERKMLAIKAAAKAGWILHQCELKTHPYLKKKGFPDAQGNVWDDLLVIPMRFNSKIVGCQLIDQEGGKKFLYGQQSKGAVFTFDAKGLPIFCEGFATGLSIRAAMQAMKVRYSIHVCFSAGNLEHVARSIVGGIVVADNDPNGVGEIVAKRTGKPYWIGDAVGEDFNDYHMRAGLFPCMMSLKPVVLRGIDASSAKT